MSAERYLTMEQATKVLAPLPTAFGFKCHGWEGPCEREDATVQRQRTSYVNDEQNWVCLCPECMKVNREHWDDAWADYYSGCF